MAIKTKSKKKKKNYLNWKFLNMSRRFQKCFKLMNLIEEHIKYKFSPD